MIQRFLLNKYQAAISESGLMLHGVVVQVTISRRLVSTNPALRASSPPTTALPPVSRLISFRLLHPSGAYMSSARDSARRLVKSLACEAVNQSHLAVVVRNAKLENKRGSVAAAVVGAWS